MATPREELEQFRAKAKQAQLSPRQELEQFRALKQQQPEQPLGQQALETLESVSTFAKGALGVGENIATLVTSAVAEPLAGLAGIAATVRGDRTPTEAIKQTREELTFKPRTEAGLSQQKDIGEFLKPAGEFLKSAEKALGDAVFESTGSPALAAVATTLPTITLEALGLGSAKLIKTVRIARVKGAPARARDKAKGVSDKLLKKTLVEAAPDIKKINEVANKIFKELDNADIAIKQGALFDLGRKLDALVKKEGIDSKVTPEAAGAVQAITDTIATGQSIPFAEIDRLRAVAKNATLVTSPAKREIALKIVDEFDAFLDNIPLVQLTEGRFVQAGGTPVQRHQRARALVNRAKRAELLQEAIELGSKHTDGAAVGIKSELSNLLSNSKREKLFTDADKKAIKKAIKGNKLDGIFSLIGGMGLTARNNPNVFSSLLGAGGLTAISGSILPVASGAVGVAVGTVARVIANKRTKGRAEFLERITRAGDDAKRITRAYLQFTPKKDRNTKDLSNLLLDPNISLKQIEGRATGVIKDAIEDAILAVLGKRELLEAQSILRPEALTPALGAVAVKENQQEQQ